MEDYFLLFKTLHLIAAFAWMAGLFYLPRLFAYHADVEPGSAASEIFKVMERRLLRAITTPAMIATLLFGALMLAAIGGAAAAWLWVKLAAVAGLVGLHMALARWRRDFEADANRRPARFYKIVNEVPTVLLVIIVTMAVVRPFAAS